MQSFFLARETVIIPGVVAALLVTAGTWLRIKNREGHRRAASFLIFAGYVFFSFSVAAFIVAGFLNR